MTPNEIVADIEALLPTLAGIASAINPAAGAAIVAAETVLPAVQKLVATGQAIIAAKAGIDPALWDQIVADNIAADARFEASGRPQN